MLKKIIFLVGFCQSLGLAEPLPVYEAIGGNFELTNHFSQPTELTDYSGKIVLLNFGYTHCPDICQITMVHYTNILQYLGATDAGKVQPLLISFDIERDTPERLKKYLANFNKNIVGLTGTRQQIDAVVSAYVSYYRKIKSEQPSQHSKHNHVLFDHTDFIFLLDQQHQVRAFYRVSDSVNAAQVVQDIQSLLREQEG